MRRSRSFAVCSRRRRSAPPPTCSSREPSCTCCWILVGGVFSPLNESFIARQSRVSPQILASFFTSSANSPLPPASLSHHSHGKKSVCFRSSFSTKHGFVYTFGVEMTKTNKRKSFSFSQIIKISYSTNFKIFIFLPRLQWSSPARLIAPQNCVNLQKTASLALCL